MTATWFQGPARKFIEVSREGFERGVAVDPAVRLGSMDDLLEAMLVATRRLAAEPHPGA